MFNKNIFFFSTFHQLNLAYHRDWSLPVKCRDLHLNAYTLLHNKYAALFWTSWLNITSCFKRVLKILDKNSLFLFEHSPPNKTSRSFKLMHFLSNISWTFSIVSEENISLSGFDFICFEKRRTKNLAIFLLCLAEN